MFDKSLWLIVIKLIVVNIKTSDGSLFQTMKSTTLSCNLAYCKTRFGPGETSLYIQANNIATGEWMICRVKINVNK